MKRWVRMTDVTKAADVSIMTVSHVLHGSSHVTEEKRQAVFAVVERLCYQRNELALALSDFPLRSDREVCSISRDCPR